MPRSSLGIIVEERIPDEDLANPEAYRQIEAREHRELEVTRSEAYWRVTRTPRFVRKDDKTAAPIGCPAPAPSLPGTLCGPRLISQIICDKFCDHLPHYRQSQRFHRRHGIELREADHPQTGWYLSNGVEVLLQDFNRAMVAVVDSSGSNGSTEHFFKRAWPHARGKRFGNHRLVRFRSG